MRWTALALVLVASLASAQATLDEKPIARRGTAAVSYADIDARMSRVPEKDRAGTIGNPERLESIVSGMLLTRQLANEARAAGLDKDPAIMKEIALSAEGVLARHRLEQVGREAKVDVKTLAKEVYQADRAQFTIPEMRRARHVLIRTEHRAIEDARKLAEEVLAEARKPGADFEAIAKARSEDETTKDHGGLLPEFGPDTMEQAFYDATFALEKPGDISDIVQTPYGFHVIQLVDVKPSRLRTFEEVREQLEQKLEQEQRQRVVQNHADTLRNLPTEAEPEAIAALRTRYDRLAKPGNAAQQASDAAQKASEAVLPESVEPPQRSP